MKKNLLTKVMTLALAATMALTPVTASAAENTVVTRDQFDAYWDDAVIVAISQTATRSTQL